jgi:hypothetical protein
MRSFVHAALLLALAAPALAQQPIEPTEEQKIDTLKQAYHINGDSMVGDHMIDLTAPRVIQTVPEMPVADPANKNELDEQADKTNRLQQKWVQLRGDRKLPKNICEEHDMHKVIAHGGKAWRCKRL